jgi:soluble lytic murein transglycosylase-like protein
MPRTHGRMYDREEGLRSFPRHPVGRARRRWPSALDSGLPPEAVVGRRYRRVYDGEMIRERRKRTFTKPNMNTFRQSPIRNGLIGLAVAGTAAPIAINRHQQALRMNPAHENIQANQQYGATVADDYGVSHVWQEMEDTETLAVNEREAVIQENIDKHAAYNLDRALAETIYDIAIENDVDPDVAFGLIRAESSFKNSSTSPVGAVGLMQLMPRTAAWLQPGVTTRELRDPQVNVRIGMKYLSQLMNKYNGDTKLALLAYNRGPGTVDRALKSGKNPDNGYADFVFGKKDHGHKLFTNR